MDDDTSVADHAATLAGLKRSAGAAAASSAASASSAAGASAHAAAGPRAAGRTRIDFKRAPRLCAAKHCEMPPDDSIGDGAYCASHWPSASVRRAFAMGHKTAKGLLRDVVSIPTYTAVFRRFISPSPHSIAAI
jgi:hypothetical protein